MWNITTAYRGDNDFDTIIQRLGGLTLLEETVIPAICDPIPERFALVNGQRREVADLAINQRRGQIQEIVLYTGEDFETGLLNTGQA